MNHDPDTVVSEVAFLNKALKAAISQGASYVYIEPADDGVTVRPKSPALSLVSRKRSPQKLPCCYDSDFSGRGDHPEREQGTVGAEARP